ncbi:MAG: hypothetical protein M3Q58_08240 [Bacteroidota bacterium]|nr:hypothetical protein [Bacteroidota bacterium]
MVKKFIFIIIGAIILGVPALYNGYPLVYSDTGTYIGSGFDSYVPPDRPIIYGLFVRHSSLAASLWLVILSQSLLVSYILYQVFKNFTQNIDPLKAFIITTTFLSFFTGISWYTSQVMPDILTSLSILSFALLLFSNKLSILNKTIISIIFVFTSITHNSNLLIITIIFLIFTLGFKWVIKQYNQVNTIQIKNLWLCLSLLLFSWLLLPTVHLMYGGGFSLSKSSHVFLMGRMVENGILSAFLNENCNDNKYKLCEYKDALPNSAMNFIWGYPDSPLYKTDGWENNKAEYQDILNKIYTTPKYLSWFISESIEATLKQLVQHEAGSGLVAYREGSTPLTRINMHFKDEVKEYLESLQNQSRLDFDNLNEQQKVLIAFSLLIILIFLITPKIISQTSPITISLIFFILTAIVANAAVTGSLANVYNRLQSRVIWLLPLLAIILLLNNYKFIINHIRLKIKQ